MIQYCFSDVFSVIIANQKIYIKSKDHKNVLHITEQESSFIKEHYPYYNSQTFKKEFPKTKLLNNLSESYNTYTQNDYIYDKVNYVNNSTKICIICPIHGEFWQTPDKHLQGEGCPICKSSKLEKEYEEPVVSEPVEEVKVEDLTFGEVEFEEVDLGADILSEIAEISKK